MADLKDQWIGTIIVKSFAPLLLCLVAITSGSCAQEKPEDRQPTAAEVKAYTEKIERAEAQAQANAIRESRAKEEVRDRVHLDKVPAQD